MPLTFGSCRSFIYVLGLQRQDAKCLHASVSKQQVFQVLCNLAYSDGSAFVYTDTGPQTSQLDPSPRSHFREKFALEKMFIPRVFLPKFIFSVMLEGRSLVPAGSELVPNV